MAPPVRPVDPSQPPPRVSAPASDAAPAPASAPPITVIGIDTTDHVDDRLPPGLREALGARPEARPPPKGAEQVIWMGAPPRGALKDVVEQTPSSVLFKPGLRTYSVQAPTLTAEQARNAELRHATNRERMRLGERPIQDPDRKPTAFEERIAREKLPFQPEHDPRTGDIVAYRRTQNGFEERADIHGRRISSGEKPLETPPIDPIDFVTLPGSAAAKPLTAAGRIALRKAAAESASVTAKAAGARTVGISGRQAVKAAARTAGKESVEVLTEGEMKRMAELATMRNTKPLTDAQKQELEAYIKKLGHDHADHFQFRAHGDAPTAYSDNFDTVLIGNDALPGPKGGPVNPANPANARVTGRATMAHELVGHREAQLQGMAQEQLWHEEAQASFRAALRAPELTTAERLDLIRDGVARLRDAPSNGSIYVWTGPLTR